MNRARAVILTITDTARFHKKHCGETKNNRIRSLPTPVLTAAFLQRDFQGISKAVSSGRTKHGAGGQIRKPPLGLSTWPVIKSLSGEAKTKMAWAMSSEVPMTPRGVSSRSA